ncbi:MAG TPA: ATP phosphoribosyltransferase regulatory subunit [Dehalococcoidia bacterium]|nr:ATP phosphoribosyltransferase regulatory subunit [Dehalococcoidia bacterium]
MPQATTTQRSRGMRDLLPEEMDRLRAVEDAFAATCRAWGYREIRTPSIEPLHLFTSAGTLSPRTLDRVYSFLDWDGWSGERVVLRPDSTIPAARLYAERLDGGRVAKLFYAQNVFRFTDDGSSREEWQCGVELIGDTGRAGDAELALLAIEALRAIGIDDITIRLSHAGLVRAVLAAAGLSPDEQAAAYDRLLDGDLAIVDDVEARLPGLNAPLRLLFGVEGTGGGFIANLRGTLAAAIPALASPLHELASTIAVLEARGFQPRIQPVLARSFEYYSGLVMKIDAGGKRVAIGGRYDELIGLVGGRAVPASGFALYLGSLLELLPAAPPAPAPRVLLQADGGDPALLSTLYDAADVLRGAGFHAETVDGMHTAPTHRLTLRAAPPRFSLSSPGATADLERLDDVVAALERAH